MPLNRAAPWLLLWTTQKGSRSEAMTLETKLKNLSSTRLIQFILKFSEGGSRMELLNILLSLCV